MKMKEKIVSVISRIPLCLWVLLIFAVAVGARVYWLQQKESLFGDEVMSLTFASNNTRGTGKNVVFGKAYTAKEIRNILFSNTSHPEEFWGDLANLRMRNSDPPHTNLYYSLLRIAVIGADRADEINFRSLLFRGFVLNMILFTGSFFVWTVLFKRLFCGNRLAVCVALAAAALNAGAITLTVFLRPYELQMFAVSVFALVFVYCAESYLKERSPASWQALPLLALAVAGALLSAYFSIVFVLLLGAALCVLAVKQCGGRELLFWVIVLLIGLAVATAIYPDYFHGFLVDRGTEAASKFELSGMADNIGKSWDGAVSILENSFPSRIPEVVFGVLVVTLVVQAVCRKIASRGGASHETNAGKRGFVLAFFGSPAAVLCVTALLSCCAILYLAPYKNFRYVAAFFPILSVAFPFVLTKIRSRIFVNTAGAVLVALFVLSAFCANSGRFSPRIEYLRSTRLNSSPNDFSGKTFFSVGDPFRWIDILSFPDDTEFVVTKRLSNKPVILQTGGKKSGFLLTVSRASWGKPPSEIRLPCGRVGKEFCLLDDEWVLPLEFDEKGSEHIVKLNLKNKKPKTRRGVFFEVFEKKSGEKSPD